MISSTIYNKEHPFYASIKERYHLCKPGSLKNTQHIVLDITHSNLTYKPGDSIGILPINDPLLVQKTLEMLKFEGSEIVIDQKNHSYNFKDFLTHHVNLKGISRKLLQFLKDRVTDQKSIEFLESLLAEENKNSFKEFATTHEIWDLFQLFPTIHLSPQESLEIFMPLLPRFYSIASAQSYVGDEIHLTISYLQYVTRETPRIGVCTHFLCSLAPLYEPIIPLFIYPTQNFVLPEDKDAALIMIGPGTGVAPFRSFIQERVKRNDRGKNWLFFGEWTREKEYFYEKEWNEWQEKCELRLSLAFSREQEQKVYVQHKMYKAAKELFSWLEQGAYLYVCGDAHYMAKDVDYTLHRIIQEEGNLTIEQAKGYVKNLKQQKRYLRDIY